MTPPPPLSGPDMAAAAFPPAHSMPEAINLHWKDRIRFAVVPVAARVARALGIRWPDIGLRFGRETVLGQASTIQRGNSDRSSRPLRIVIVTMVGGHPHTSSADSILAMALQARGHDVRMVMCDQALPLCEAKQNGAEARWARTCARCYGSGRRLYGRLGFETFRVSELVKHAALEPDPRWDNYAESALMKHYRAGILPDTEDVRGRRTAFQQAAAVSAAVGDAIVAMRPDRVLMTHGLYTTFGPARSVILDAGIPLACYDKARKRYTEQFTWTHSSDTWNVDREWEKVKDTPLTPPQENKLDAYLDSRRTHSADSMVYNRTPEAEEEATFAQLGLPRGVPTAVVFTNVIWDGASVQREITFPNPIDWVVATVEWYRAHPERQCVIRIHPAELVIGTTQPFADLLRARVPVKPPNVRVIEPHEPVNSWSLLRIAEIGIVHTTTVGMELALEGKPCLIVSSSTYRGKGFTVDVATQEEYFALLANPPRPDPARMKELARRFTYLLFERFQLPFPYLFETRHGDVRAWTFDSIEQVLSYGAARLICESLEQQTDFLLPA